jgi:DNA-binding transcriptional ArsR family regulator
MSDIFAGIAPSHAPMFISPSSRTRSRPWPSCAGFSPKNNSIALELVLDAALAPAHVISMKLEQSAKQLEALGNPTRLKLYRTLVRAGEGGLPVGRLQEKLKIAPSTLSHHLHRLILTGLVTQERHGTTLICRASYPAMRALIGFLADECCADAPCVPAEAAA